MLLALFSSNTLANTAVYKDEFVGHPEGVNSVAFSADGKLLASGSWDKTVQLWEVKMGEQKQVFTEYVGWADTVAFSPDGTTLASGCGEAFDKTVQLWDIKKAEQKRRLTGHMSGIQSVAFSPDEKVLASGSTDGTVLVWKVAD